MSNIQKIRLSNGLECFLDPDPSREVFTLQVLVQVGSAMEKDKDRGICHFIEHMLFKGSKNFGTGQLGTAIEALGGDVNAYTTFDCTVYHCTVPAEHLEWTVNIFADSIFKPLFPPDETEREREVILEEIKRGLDNPGSLMTKLIFGHMYKGTAAARPVIGDMESVKRFSSADLRRFHGRFYVPKNISVALVGNIGKTTTAKKFLEKHFDLELKKDGLKFKPFKKMLPDAKIKKYPIKPHVVFLKGDYKQPRVDIVFPSTKLDSPHTVSLDVASYILGGSETSRLNRVLRDDLQLVSSVGMSVYSPNFPGITEASLTCEEKNIPEVLKNLAAEFSKFLTAEFPTSDEITRTKTGMAIDRLYSAESVDGKARNLVNGLMSKYKEKFDDVYFSQLSRQTPASILKALKNNVNFKSPLIACTLPLESTLDAKTLEKAYLEGLNIPQSKIGKVKIPNVQKPIVFPKPQRMSKPEIFHFKIKNGLNVTYKYVKGFPLFSLAGVTQGGLRFETEKTSGIYNAMTFLTGTASKKIDYQETSHFFENYGADLNGFSGKDTFGFHFHCAKMVLDKVLPKVADVLFNEPVFTQNLWEMSQSEITDSIRSLEDRPGSMAMRRLQELIYGAHPYRFSTQGTRANVESWTEKDLFSLYQTTLTQGRWQIGSVGSVKPEVLQKKLELTFKNFSPKESYAAKNAQIGKVVSISRFIKKDREQSHLAFGRLGLNWSHPDRLKLDLLNAILGGFGGRLFSELREKQSLAYTVSPILSHGFDPGLFGVYIGCSASKVEQSYAGIVFELRKLQSDGISQHELERARNYISGHHKIGLQKLSGQSSWMALNELYGLGVAEITEYPEKIKKLQLAEINEFAAKFFDPKQFSFAVVGQNDLNEKNVSES